MQSIGVIPASNIYIYGLHYTVSVLGREEGYTVKYGLSPRDCPRAQPKGNPKGSGLITELSELKGLLINH